MAQHNEQKQAPASNLKGTLVSVMLVGVIIIMIWGGVFALFTLRNG